MSSNFDELSVYARVFFNLETSDESSIGHGAIDLIAQVGKTGSLNKAAKDFNMAYSRAWTLLNTLEEVLDMQLVERKGAHGSNLTKDGKLIVELFQRVEERTNEAAKEILDEELEKLKEQNG